MDLLNHKTPSLLKMVEMNRRLVQTNRVTRERNTLIRQEIGYLIDAATPTDTGEYIVPVDTVENLRELVFGKRGHCNG